MREVTGGGGQINIRHDRCEILFHNSGVGMSSPIVLI